MKTRTFQLWTTAVVLSASFAARIVEAAPAPSITGQPQSESVVVPSNGTFTVVASGQAPLHYQWYLGGTNALTNSAGISGATTSNLSISTAGAGAPQVFNPTDTSDITMGPYSVIVSNAHGTATSSNAVLMLLFPAKVAQSPTNQFTVLGKNAAFSTFVTGSGPVYFAWYFNGAPLTDGGRISGSATSFLFISNVQTNDAGAYQLVVTNAYGVSTGAVSTLTVLLPPAITSSPTNQTILQNSNVTFTAVETGTAPLSNQWYFNGSPLVDGGRVSGSGTTNLIISNAQTNDTGSYQLVVTNNFGSATSAVAVLTVLGPPVITSQPVDDTVVENQPGGFSVTATGAPPLSYELVFNGNPLGFGSAHGFFYTHTVPSDAGNYYFIITNVYGAVTSDVVTLTVLIPPQITTQPQPPSQTLAAGAAFALSVAASGTAPLGYQWYFNNAPLSDGGRVSGSATANLMISNSQTNDSGNYFVVATNSAGTATSSNAIVSVLQPPSVTSGPVSQTLPQGSNVTFSAIVSGDAPLSYRWQFNSNSLVDGGQISGSSTPNLTISNLQFTNGGNYVLLVTNPVGSAASTAAVLTVLSPPIITQQPPTNQNVVQGTNVFFPAAVIGTAPFGYQWYFNGNLLTDGGRVSGSAAADLEIANAQTNDSGPYQLVVTNSFGATTSTVAALTVQLPVNITGQPTNQTVLVGKSATFTVTATGFVPPSYSWYSNGIALANGGRISGATSTNLTISNVNTNDSGTSYQVVVTNVYGSTTSAMATLTVLAPAQITTQPVSQAVLLGSNVTFSITASGSGPLNYQWYLNGTALVDGGRISGSATPALTVSDVQSSDAGGYVAIVTNLLSSATSQTASLTPQTVLAPSTRYVALTSTNPTAPYLDWSTAATNIQDAVDAAVAGDSIVVSNGTYTSGGRVISGTKTNRVAVNKSIVLQSFNGPSSTIILGSTLPAGLGQGPQIRCVYLTNGAVLAGFTLTNGGATGSGDPIRDQSGGGVWSASPSAIISNCVIIGSAATQYGGGAFGGTLINCLLTTNTASFGGGAASNILLNCTLSRNATTFGIPKFGGGAAGCTASNCLFVANRGNEQFGGGAAFCLLTSCVLSNNSAQTGGGGVAYGTAVYCLISSNNAGTGGGGGVLSNVANNCILRNNSAVNGGGAYNSTLLNCTVISNVALGFTTGPRGGGMFGGSAFNSIIYNNSSSVGSNSYFPSSGVLNYCCTFPLPTNGMGNITNDPAFMNLAGGNLHLQSNSLCINSGNNAYVTASTDFDGNPRIVGGTVDIGAYEYQTPTSIISYAWLQQYGLPTDGSVDFADLDGTAFNVYQDWIAGLNPLDPASVLSMQNPVVNTNSIGLTVSWLSVSNRTYFLQRATDLVAQPAFSTIQSNIAGQAGTTSLMDSTATNGGPYFYRVGVQQ